MAVADLWAVGMVLAAFAGGAFGASIGALQSFTLAGMMVVVGELYALAGRTVGAIPAADITGAIAFGAVLGPHVAFGGGAAAAAYAARRGYLDVDSPYPAKEITRGLGNRPDVLAVGGGFGVLGYWVATLAGTFGVPTDPVALGVVLSALAHRLAFGYSLVGAAPGRLLDMSPFERARGTGRAGDPAEPAAVDGGVSDPATVTGGDSVGPAGTTGADGESVDPWLAYQYRWSHVAALGLAVGALGGYIAYLTASAFLGFGISVVAIGFLIAGVAEIPVTHHITLPASTAVVASVDAPFGSLTPAAVATAMPRWEAVVIGAAFGLTGALLGEFLQRVLYAHAETHLDPPAASIVASSFLIALLALVGVLPSAAWIPLP